MTTGRINQVATSSFVDAAVEPEFQSRNEAFASECGMFASSHEFRNCRVPLLRPGVCAWDQAPPEDGLCCTSAARFNLSVGTLPRRAKGTMDWDSDTWKVGQNQLSIQLQNKSTGHPETECLALGVKAKKEKQTRRFAFQADAWSHPEAEDRNRRGCTKRGEK